MAANIALQASRYELKYIVDESQARYLRALIQGYTLPDEHMGENSGVSAWGYPVRSLYLDNPSLDFCRQTMHGIKNRFKLRIRFYDELPTSPVYLEIKQRINGIIRKKRAIVKREAGLRLAGGAAPDLADLASQDQQSKEALLLFCRLRDTAGATPQAYVAYMREAHTSVGTSDLRITFDRQIIGCRYRPGNMLKLPEHAAPARVGGVVLELKYTNCFPAWLRAMVQQLHLRRTSYPKYVECIKALHVPLSDRFPAKSRVAI